MITVSLWEISHPCVLMKENWGSPRPAQMNRRVSRELTYKAVKQQGNACKVPAARPGPAPPCAPPPPVPLPPQSSQDMHHWIKSHCILRLNVRL